MVLEIHEWEIWHTYTTYLLVEAVNLDDIARRLVESGIALCSMLPDGRTYWSSGPTVGSGTTSVSLDPYASHATCNLDRDPDCKTALDGFAAEAWLQACYFRFSEQRVFGESNPLPPPYVRAFLGQCNLVSKAYPASKARLYPILLIYESGVVVLELRTLSPDSPTPLDGFISGAVNLYQHPFERIDVPPGLAKMATRAYYHSYRGWTFPYRAALLWLERGHEEAVRRLTRSSEDGDFAFDLAPLSTEDVAAPCENLSTFAFTLFHTTAFLLGRPRFGIGFLLRGQRSTPELGDFWSGRPHVHLIRFEGQCDTATENELRHGEAFGGILLRVLGPDSAVLRRSLPKDARLFEDYNAYVTSAASLWVWSKRGLARQPIWGGPNRGHLIYEHQALVELLEYGYMLHRGVLERASSYGNTDEVMSARRALLRLKLQMSEASHFGEIRDLLDHGWGELRLPELRAQIQEALNLRETETRELEARSTTRVGQALTVLFGLVAVPALAEQVVQPLWELLGVQRPIDPAVFKTIANLLSLFGVGLIVAVLVRWLGARRPKRPEDLKFRS